MLAEALCEEGFSRVTLRAALQMQSPEFMRKNSLTLKLVAEPLWKAGVTGSSIRPQDVATSRDPSLIRAQLR